ncbi:type III-B CRISPR module RAMP protein Cmr6 [Pyrobaculum sp.]|uniref:type III-B CRISPR module RAMP protein Cmr6 n=1 Tax=Pyrobaculum sp. TaxID=2004705 RepID=UPI00316EC1F7
MDAEVETRLTIHVKSPYIPLEIGISWHPLLNLPYIPATSLKGAARAYAEVNNIRPCGKAPEELFGKAGGAGLVELTDAYPVKCRDKLIEPDIINPHYREVEGAIGEADASPTPLLFPAVARGVVFRFFVAPRAEADGKCLTDVLDVIRGALAEGIGAKTRLGYGVLKL